ncbi:MAG: hypothetical protein LBH32_04910 [Dysgonamonadaceae bacterium]|nr:hypothetical protein [Dysgonamonadaceae bacterium]
MKKNLFFLLAALCSLQSFAAGLIPATLVKIDGEKIECLVQDFRIDAKELYYKESQDSKFVSIKSDELIRAIIHYDDGDIIFDYVKYINHSSFMRGKDKVAKKPMWMQLVISGPCSLYTYRIITRQNRFTYTEDWYACKKQDEDVPRIVSSISSGITVNLFDQFYKALSNYFSDYPELAEKIKAKKYSRKDIVEIVNEYNLEKSVKITE